MKINTMSILLICLYSNGMEENHAAAIATTFDVDLD